MLTTFFLQQEKAFEQFHHLPINKETVYRLNISTEKNGTQKFQFQYLNSIFFH